MAENNNNTLPPIPKGFTVKQEVLPPVPKGFTISKTEPAQPKPKIQVTKEQYKDLEKTYSALDESFKDIQKTMADVSGPFNPLSIENATRVNVFGYKLDLPKIQKSKPADSEPEQPEQPEQKPDDPYKALYKIKAKELNIGDIDLEQTSPAANLNKQKLNDLYLQDLNQMKNLQGQQLTDFVNQKKAFLDKKEKEEVAKIREKGGALTIDLLGFNTALYFSPKNREDLEEVNLKSEYANLKSGLDEAARTVTFKKAPTLIKNIDTTLSLSDEQIRKQAEKTGNNILNSTNEADRVRFEAYGESGIEEAFQTTKYPQSYKDKLAYTGIQSEISVATDQIEEIVNIISEKNKKIEDLSLQLKEDPTNKAIAQEIQKIGLEIKPFATEIEKRKSFITKLSSATLELSTIEKERSRQRGFDELDRELMNSTYGTIFQTFKIPGDQFKNAAIKTLKKGLILSGEATKLLGRNPDIVEISKQNILDVPEFTIPSKIKYNQPLEKIGEGLLDYKINWEIAAPLIIKTTAEAYVMGKIALPFGKLGGTSVIGKQAGRFAGLLAGSELVFGGDMFIREIEKGLSTQEALLVSSARVAAEAFTELANPLEFMPFDGINKKVFGKALTKADFVRYVGSNWKTMFPKIKAAGLDVGTFLFNFGKSVGMESFEEVMSDLLNYGIDEAVIRNIKPDYSRDGKFTLESEIETALTTALTMPLMSGVGAYYETKQSKYMPGLRWQASQNVNTFLANLKENFNENLITKEFYETGVKEVETLSNLYNANKAKIDLAPEDERVQYLDALYQYNTVSEQFLAETNESKKEKLADEVETALTKVQEFDKEYAPLVGNPQAQRSKAEERYIENIKTFATPQDLKVATPEDLTEAKNVLNSVLEDPFSPTVAAEAQKHIDLIDAEIKAREEAAKQPPVEVEPADFELDTKTYASKILKLSDEDIEDLEAKGELEELVTKDKKPKIKTAEITKQFEEAKSLQGEERIQKLSELATEAAKEGLFDLYKQIDTYKTSENKVSIGNSEFIVGSKVDYDGETWEIVSIDGVGKLVKGNKTITPSDPENIKPIEFKSAKDLLGEEPTTDTKADIEKRKQKAESKITPIDIDVVDKSGKKTGEVRIKEYATIYGEKRLAAKTEEELKKLIEAEYDAELAALEAKEPVKEQTEQVKNVKEALKALDEKELVTDPSDKNYYINKNNPSERYARVSTLKGEFDGTTGDSANRGTIIDNMLRDYVAGSIKTFEQLKQAYNKYSDKYEADEFTEDFLKDLFGIFQEIKEVTKNVELISDIPTMWGTLNGKPFAGTIDLLGIRNDGSVFIIDLKTSSQNRRDKEGRYYETYKEGDTIQQSAYAELLRQRTGIEIKNITILPIQVTKKRGRYISATSNKDEKGKFTMPVTIDRALFPEKKAEVKPTVEAKPIPSAEDLQKLAAEKLGKPIEKVIISKKLQSIAKRLTGEKYISKMNDQQRSTMEKYLLSLKSKKEIKEERLKDKEAERADNKKTVQESGLRFKLGNITAIWNFKTQSFEFYTTKYDKVKDGLVNLSASLLNKPNLLNNWWNDFASEKVKDAIIDAKYEFLDLLRPSNGIVDNDPTITAEFMLISLLKGMKFSLTDAKDFTDTSNVWFQKGARTISDFASDLVNDPLMHDYLLSSYDEFGLVDYIKDLINEYPEGITNNDVEEKSRKENITAIDLKQLEEEIATEYGVNLQTVLDKLDKELDEYEKQRNEQRRAEEELQEEDPFEGPTDLQETFEETGGEGTAGENPVEVNTPVTGTEDAKDEAKENKKNLDNPVNPFRNAFDNRKGDLSASIFSLVAEKLFNLAKTKDLAKEGFYISVVPSQSIPWEQLSERTKKYFGADDSEKRLNDTGKYLVITDREGKAIQFTPEGEVSKDKGSWAFDVFPDTKSETELVNAKFEPTNSQLQKQGKTREWFKAQVKKIFEARKAKNTITYTISNVHQGGYQVDVENPMSIKQSLGDKKAIVKIAANGKVYFTVEGETTPNEVNRPLFTKRQIDTILHIISNKGVSKTDTQERQQFVTKLIGEKFSRVVDGKKVELAFKFDKGLIIPQVKNEGEKDFRNLTNEEFADILSKITPNVNKMLLETNNPFNYYDYNGKTVSKKVYPSYSDFIIDNFDTYNNIFSTEVKPEHFIEVGDPVNSVANQIIEDSKKPAEPEVVVQKEVKPAEVINESPVEKKPTKWKKIKTEDKIDPFKDSLNRSKTLVREVTPEQEAEAEAWFNTSPISKFINFRDMRNIVNSDAFATWKTSSTTLWKGGKFTDLYHEAWHEFSQLYLTKEQKKALYNEAMNSKEGKKALEEYAKELGKEVSKLTPLEKYFAIEEMIAEDFFNYALNKKQGKELILGQKPKRNSTFRKIWNYLKELFTGKTDLQTYYERLYTGQKLNNYTRSLDNTFFPRLNKGLEGVVDGEARNLTNVETKQLYQVLDYLFGQAFENPEGKTESLPITLMFEKNSVASGIYKNALNTFQIQFNNAVDRIELLEPGTPEFDAEELNLNNLNFIIQNWSDVVNNHKNYSSFFKLSKDAIKFEEEGIADPTDVLDEENDVNNDRDSSVVKNENVSSKEAASNETVYLIATLATENPNPFLPMFNLPVDFKQTWDILTKNLEGTLEYPELYEKIKNLEGKYSWAGSLLKRLPDPNKAMLTEAEQRLKSSFLIDIGKPKIDTYEASVDSEGRFSYSKSATTDEAKIKQTWNNNFTNLSPDKSKFIEYDDDDTTYLNAEKLLEEFKNAFPYSGAKYKELDKKQLFADRIQFLSNFGIVFPEEATTSPEFFDFVTSFIGPIPQLYKLTKVLVSKEERKKVRNPFSDLRKIEFKEVQDTNIHLASKIFPLLQKEALKYSEEFITQSVKNAANNTVWQIRDWNYISKIYNALNNVKKYPTYQSLINDSWLKQFDIAANPYVSGVILNSIFDLKTGERRKDNNGNYVTIELQDYNGLVLNLKTGTKNEGKTTTDLTDFEKLVQNFNTLLLFGVQEHLRYGDKSSSFATKVSHIYNPISGKLEIKKNAPIVSIDKFVDTDPKSLIVLPSQGLSHLLTALKAELIPMKNNFEENIGSNWKFYKDNIKNLGIFEGILSQDTANILKKEYVQTKGADITEVLKKHQSAIQKDIIKYLEAQREVLDKKLSNNLIESDDFISSTLTEKAGESQLKAAYVLNSLLYNIEHTKMVTGDPRFYKSKGGKKDPFKRFSAWSATGRIFLTDKQTNNFIENKVNAIKDAVAKKLGITIAPKVTNGMINSVIFKDAIYDSKALREEYTKYFLSKGYSQERIDEILKKYEEITEADGQGYMTLDEYKQSKLRAGSSHWTKAHEEAYQKEAAFVRGERIQGMSLEETALFVPQKWQYAGTAIDNGRTLPVFYKFSVAPLIPSMIKGKSFEKIHDNLVRQNAGLALFESGSKISSVQEFEYDKEGNIKLDKNNEPITKSNSFYSDYEKRTPYEGDYTINSIFYNYLKEQVNIEPELKEKVTFSSQMRKLLHINLFKEGKAITKKALELEKRFGDAIDKLISLEREKVISQMGAKFEDGKWTFDDKKLAEFFVKEFEERGLPDEVIDYFQVGENGKFVNPLDASNKRDKIENLLFSIANKRLIQQKINGEALIQLAATGFELETDKLKEVVEDAGLPFYRVVNGVTQAMKVKIAFSDRWKPLLKLKHPDGKTIDTVERLNEAIKDDKWLKENYKKITIVAVRIPVQGLNSQEFMEVFEFLPPSAGQVIVVSPYLVSKSGGDFDIDKLTTFFPNLDDSGNLYETTSEEKIKEKYESLLKQYKKAVGKAKDEAALSPTEKLEKEKIKKLADEIFGEDRVPSFEKFRSFNLKKSYENEIVSIMRETLELEENFEQLISPNDTNLLDEDIDDLKASEEDKPKGTWTEVVEFAEIGRQFKSNLVGKSNLGIAAVWNTFFALSQRAGLVLNNNHIHFTSSGKEEKRDTRINLPHNETSDGRISISGLMDVENKHKISKIFEQAINGFVDVAKDDWIFYINGVKEIVPTMLFTAAAGVNNKNLIAFYNQPILKRYVKEMQKYRNLFVKLKSSKLAENANIKALEDIFISTEGITDSTLQSKITALAEEIQKPTQKNGKDDPFARYKKLIAILDYLTNKAAKNKDLFTTQKLEQSVFQGKEFTPEENLMILAHFDELRDLGNKVSNLQRSLNADTKRAADSAAVYDRIQRLKQSRNSELFDEAAVARMFNDSTIKAFTNERTGFDKFISQFFTNVLEITNHRIFNDAIREIAIGDNELTFQNKTVNPEKFRKTLKNDFISYLYQNSAYLEDGITLVAKATFKLFVPKTALANELAQLKSKLENYPILSQLVPDTKQGDKPIINIKLKSKLTDRDELNSAVNQIRQLLQFNDVDFTEKEQLEVQAFAKKFVQFAIIQSGLNSSIYNLMDLVPNEEYTKIVAPVVKGFKETLDKNPDLAKAEIKKFYNQVFKRQNPSFYDFKEEMFNLNKTNIRGKNLTLNSAGDFTGEKKIAADLKQAEYIEKLPSKVTTYPKVNSATIKNNPNSLVLVENNAKLTATQGLKETNFASVITKEAIGKPLLDSNLPLNEKIVDDFINEIIEKSKNYANIVFNESGYGQHLLPENKRTFDYLSSKLYTYFGFQNPGFTPIIPMEVVEPTTPAKLTTTQPVTTPETARTIYDKLGNKTQSENVEIAGIGDLKNVTYSGKTFWSEVVPEAKGQFGDQIIVAYRGDRKKSFLENYRKGYPGVTIGNPFDWQNETGTRDEQGIKSTKRFIHWMITGDNMGVAEATPEYRQAIIDDIKNGKLKNRPIIYYQEKGYATHATALDYLINKYDWNKPTQPSTSVNPLVEAGIKPTDMYGNAAKDIQMASESTQFIGFGTIMKEGNVSSTDKYAKAWGNKANTGSYTANDTIMVSGSGNFGRGGVDKKVEAEAIKKTLSEKYKPLLDKAIAAGASFRIGNQYTKGNLSDELVAKYLQQKGYTEEKLNGYSRWTSPIKATQQPSTQPTERKTYSGKVTSLQPNQIFVFGSNPEGRHGAGAAKDAKDLFGAKYGQGRGMQGQSYALVTKNLKAGFIEPSTSIKYEKAGEKSVSPAQITTNIKELYAVATQNPTKEFLIPDYSKSNLNGYTGQEMADMFANAGPIPNNIVFNENFDKLIPTQPTTKPTEDEQETDGCISPI